jgi:4-hydroxybenzoate polyprenyltransferase
LLVLTWLYNDLGASDEHFLVRHATNALGFTSFSAGATQAILHSTPLPTALYQWLAMIAVVITFTIQFQDMEDQEGDRLRGRLTMPIVLGDNITRWANAATILVFSVLAAKFWDLALPLYLLPASLGAAIAARTLLLKTLKADKQTFKLWCLWLMMLYLLPLVKRYSFLVGL